LSYIGIAVIGLSLKFAAECGFGIGVEDGGVELAVVVHQERLVVGHELRGQRDRKQREKKPQRPKAALVRTEVVPAAAADGRQVETFRHMHLCQLKPPGARSRCADRPPCRADRLPDSSAGRAARRSRAWRTSADSRG